MEKYKILIIEDDPIIQTELQVLLNGNGYEAWLANFLILGLDFY